MVVVPRESLHMKHRAIITVILIVINVVVYIYTSLQRGGGLISSSYDFITEYGFRPVYFLSDPLKGLFYTFTSMFIHADIIHIFFNMYFLWIFGSRVEGFLGHLRFICLYILSGLAAVLFHSGFTPYGGIDSLVIPAVGASGAISGVLGAFLLMLPHTRLTVCMFFLFIPFCFNLPASAFLIIWFAQQLIYGYLRLGGVAYFAHIGGFIMGLLLAPYIARRESITPEYLDMILKYLYEYFGIRWIKPRGLGTSSKVILIAMIMAVTAGFLYSAYTSNSIVTKDHRVYVANLEVVVNNESQSDRFIISITQNRSLEVFPSIISALDNVRITGNRLAYILYNTNMSGQTFSGDIKYNARISGIYVDVTIEGLLIRYDDIGMAYYAQGLMRTYSVRVGPQGAELGEYLIANFEYESRRFEISNLSVICLFAASIAVFSIPSVLRSDEALVYQTTRQPGYYPFL
ncbi:MAG: rhomboid family intramembrane serine protease [Desulfurococcaceae archaeon]